MPGGQFGGGHLHGPVTPDNSVKRGGNSHVIAFSRVGSAKRVEFLSDGSLYSVINT